MDKGPPAPVSYADPVPVAGMTMDVGFERETTAAFARTVPRSANPKSAAAAKC